MKNISFKGWDNCCELTAGDFKIIVTTDVGPRIIGGFLGDNPFNIFNVDEKLAGTSGAEKWVNYGGHRLWHSPETLARTYQPDNAKVEVTETEESVAFSVYEPASGIFKAIEITADEECGMFTIDHIIRNDGIWGIEVAPWALSVMAPGGMAVIPHNTQKQGLTPSKFISVWPYTQMNDPRINWGGEFVTVRQNPDRNAKPMKIGMLCQEGYVAYINNSLAFVKSFNSYDEYEKYPDNNCNTEVYTCSEMLELETLGPLTKLEPGDSVAHTESWTLQQVEAKLPESDEDIIEMLQID